MPTLYYLFRDSSEKSICSFSHLEAFTKRKFIGGPGKSTFFLEGSCQHWPALNTHCWSSRGRRRAKESLSYQEHPGTRFWQSQEAHASLLDYHLHALTISSTGSRFASPPCPTWHWAQSHTSEPRHVVWETTQPQWAHCRIDSVKSTVISQDFLLLIHKYVPYFCILIETHPFLHYFNLIFPICK